MSAIFSCNIDDGSLLYPSLADAYFYDCYAKPISADAPSALALYLHMMSKTPRWVDVLMRLRNRIVGLFGLKDLGTLSAVNKNLSRYQVGDRIGIFTLLALNENEVILGDSDKHLAAQISVRKTILNGQNVVTTATVVHVRNTLGRVYLAFVVPVHRIIVPTMLARLD